jgi:K+-transporting ATPase c subunit
VNQLKPAIVSLALLTVLTGVVYPLAVTAVAQVFFPAQANGSLIVKDGVPIGSALIGNRSTIRSTSGAASRRRRRPRTTACRPRDRTTVH